MVAIQRGTERPNDVVIITGHIDSRVTDVMNFTSDAPGANDDGSGTAAVIEAARVLSKHKFPGTIVYAALSGEEQGLYGGKVLADYAKAQGWNVVTDLNNDIIGNSCCVRRRVRRHACARACPKGRARRGRTSSPAQTHSLGGENDAPSRNISRFLDSLADRLKIGLDVRRSGAPTASAAAATISRSSSSAIPRRGSPSRSRITTGSTRICGPRTASDYGDTIDHIDFAYLAKMTKLNVAALAAIASAPPPPEPKVEGAVSTDTTMTWDAGAGRGDYRRPLAAHRCQPMARRARRLRCLRSRCRCRATPGRAPTTSSCKIVLPHIRVDDWVFGVSSVSKDGFESPVASAVPGGAFKPYIAPEKK